MALSSWYGEPALPSAWRIVPLGGPRPSLSPTFLALPRGSAAPLADTPRPRIPAGGRGGGFTLPFELHPGCPPTMGEAREGQE